MSQRRPSQIFLSQHPRHLVDTSVIVERADRTEGAVGLVDFDDQEMLRSADSDLGKVGDAEGRAAG